MIIGSPLQISAGSDEVTSHSAAISDEGELYTWGHAAICGHSGHDPPELSEISNKTSVIFPKLVKSFEVRLNVLATLPLAATQYLTQFILILLNRNERMQKF